MANPSGKRHWNWRNFFTIFIVSFGLLAYGYPASIIGTTLGQPSFLLYMKLLDPKTEGLTNDADQLIGAMSGVFQAGAVLGIFGCSYVMEKWGRKAGFIFSATLSIVAGVLLTASQGAGMFIAFRFVAGAGSYGFFAVTPVWMSELATADLRGFLVGMSGVMIALGYSIATYMGLAFYSSTNPSAQWRGPLGLGLLFPAVCLLALPFLPESPRWLLLHGQKDKARKVVFALHAMSGDPDHTYATEEFFQMEKQAEIDVALDASWIELFRKPAYRKRVILAVGFAFFSQCAGSLVINNYGPTLYKILGFGTRDQLILACGWITVAVVFNLVGALMMDRVGRRPLMIGGLAGCCVCLIVFTAIVAKYATTGTNKAATGAGVGMLYLFLAMYSIGLDSAGTVFFAELFPNHIRSKGLPLAVATIALTDLIWLQSAETAINHIGWKFFLIFIILSAIGVVWSVLSLPETKNIPLEEMAALFGDTDEVAVFSTQIHMNKNTHEISVDGSSSSPAEMVVVSKEKGYGVSVAEHI